jgi:GNAT superfamily N-acetyltransferase
MKAADADFGFTQAVVLRDGTAATIRVMRPDDRERLVAAFARLDETTIYTRFFSLRKELPKRALDRIAAIDFVHLAGVVATVGQGPEEVVIGSATYVADRTVDAVNSVEVAFTVEPHHQRQGLGRQLLAALVVLARHHGIARFTADVLARNAAMLTVFERSGLPMRTHREADVVQVEMALEPGATWTEARPA